MPWNLPPTPKRYRALSASRSPALRFARPAFGRLLMWRQRRPSWALSRRFAPARPRPAWPLKHAALVARITKSAGTLVASLRFSRKGGGLLAVLVTTLLNGGGRVSGYKNRQRPHPRRGPRRAPRWERGTSDPGRAVRSDAEQAKRVSDAAGGDRPFGPGVRVYSNGSDGCSSPRCRSWLSRASRRAASASARVSALVRPCAASWAA